MSEPHTYTWSKLEIETLHAFQAATVEACAAACVKANVIYGSDAIRANRAMLTRGETE